MKKSILPAVAIASLMALAPFGASAASLASFTCYPDYIDFGFTGVSGETTVGKLDQQLKKEGYDIKRIINYRSTHIEKFKDSFIEELKINMPDIVYVYSQNSASSFLKFIKLYQSENLWMDTNLMCLGEKTSAILNEIKWKKIFLFNPGEEEFLLYKI